MLLSMVLESPLFWIALESTGDDGPSHNGVWDLALTGIVPTLKVAAPRDGARLKQVLREAVDINDRPTLIRFPKGAAQADNSCI